MVAIGVEQSLSNSDLYEHRCLGKTKKVYKTAGKCEDQQKYKGIIEAALVSTPEGCTDDILITPNPSVSTKNWISRKSLRQFTEMLYVKHNNAVPRFGAAKEKRNEIKRQRVLVNNCKALCSYKNKPKVQISPLPLDYTSSSG